MQLSKQLVDPKVDKQIRNVFFQVVADLRNAEEASVFLQDILTDAELIAIAKRLAIGLQLANGHSYDGIRRQLKVSSATIASIQEKLAHEGGFRLALRKIEADKWANQMTGKIMGWFGVKSINDESNS